MRSRYTAFALGIEDHVFRTWHPRTRPDDLSLPADVSWTGLEILSTRDGGAEDATGEVEFVAHLRTAGGPHALHETSRFERRAGRWVYVDGDVDPDVRLRSRR
jgi:SEC-C motif domain protein